MLEILQAIEEFIVTQPYVSNLVAIGVAIWVIIQPFVNKFRKKNQVVIKQEKSLSDKEVKSIIREELQPLKDMLITAYTSAKSVPADVKLKLIDISNDKVKETKEELQEVLVKKVEKEIEIEEKLDETIEEDMISKIEKALL